MVSDLVFRFGREGRILLCTPQTTGKLYLKSILVQRFLDQLRPIVTIDFSQSNLIDKPDGIMGIGNWIRRNALIVSRSVDSKVIQEASSYSEAIGVPSNPEAAGIREAIQAITTSLREKSAATPVLFFENLGSAQVHVARAILRTIRELMNAPPMMDSNGGNSFDFVILSDGDLLRIVGVDLSQFDCAIPYVVSGFDEETFTQLIEGWSRKVDVILSQESILRIYRFTGGDVRRGISMLNELAMIASIRDGVFLPTPIEVSQELLEKVFRIYSERGPGADISAFRTLQNLAGDHHAEEAIRALLRSPRTSGRTIKSILLENYGVVRPDSLGNPEYVSEFIQKLVEHEYRTRRMADLELLSGRDKDAFVKYRSLTVEERRRPTNDRDYPELRTLVGSLRLLLRGSKDLETLQSLLADALFLVFGFAEVGFEQSGVWKTERVIPDAEEWKPANSRFSSGHRSNVRTNIEIDQSRASLLCDIGTSRKGLGKVRIFASDLPSKLYDTVDERTLDLLKPLFQQASDEWRRLSFRDATRELRAKANGILSRTLTYSRASEVLEEARVAIAEALGAQLISFKVFNLGEERALPEALKVDAKVRDSGAEIREIPGEVSEAGLMYRAEFSIPKGGWIEFKEPEEEEEFENCCKEILDRLAPLYVVVFRHTMLQRAIGKLGEPLVLLDRDGRTIYRNSSPLIPSSQAYSFSGGWQRSPAELELPYVWQRQLEVCQAEGHDIVEYHDGVNVAPGERGFLSTVVLEEQPAAQPGDPNGSSGESRRAITMLHKREMRYYEQLSQTAEALLGQETLKGVFNQLRLLTDDLDRSPEWYRIYQVTSDSAEGKELLKLVHWGGADGPVEYDASGIDVYDLNPRRVEGSLSWGFLDEGKTIIVEYRKGAASKYKYNSGGVKVWLDPSPHAANLLQKYEGDCWAEVPLIRSNGKPWGKVSIACPLEISAERVRMLTVLGKLLARTLELFDAAGSGNPNSVAAMSALRGQVIERYRVFADSLASFRYGLEVGLKHGENGDSGKGLKGFDRHILEQASQLTSQCADVAQWMEKLEGNRSGGRSKA